MVTPSPAGCGVEGIGSVLAQVAVGVAFRVVRFLKRARVGAAAAGEG